MGVRVLSFQEKRKNQRKADWAVLPQILLSSVVLGELYIGRCVCLLSPLIRSKSQRRLLSSLFVAHASYNLTSFRDSANGCFLYRHFSPAPCSPPLGGSIADSAVRFTPAVKYGGRENRPSRRETRCMSGHPCRAHHKLKWARKVQSVLGVLYSHLPRSESRKTICAAKFRCPPTLRRPPKLRKVNPCSTGVGNNPLTIPEHSRRAVSRMPKARRSRLSLTRCAGCATLPNHKPRRQRFVVHPSSARSTLFDRGWQQPLDHPGAQPARRVKDAEGTAKPLVLDSVRWLGYSRNVHILKPRRNPAPKSAHERGGLPRERWRCFRSLTAQTAAILSLSRPR